ncbi:Uncharacterised protein [Bacillus freudenreichii]|nr:Uncharacterised protein [Bacillus freudenreichii]
MTERNIKKMILNTAESLSYSYSIKIAWFNDMEEHFAGPGNI